MRFTQEELNAAVRSKPPESQLKIVTTMYDVKGQETSSKIYDDVYAQKHIGKSNQKYLIRFTSHHTPANPYDKHKGEFRKHIIKTSALDDRMVEVSLNAFNLYLEFLKTGEIGLLGRIRKDNNYAKHF